MTRKRRAPQKETAPRDAENALGFAEARELVLKDASPLGIEKVDLGKAWGRVLAAEVRAERNLPPWDNSAMDGFAVRSADVRSAGKGAPVELRVTADLPAGKKYSGRLNRGEAVRIMTGAPVPEGADAIARVEITHELSRERIQVQKAVAPGTDIRRAGEDIRAGEVILSPGVEIRPAEVAILASLNRPRVPVFLEPRVAVLATGDELADLGTVGPDQIVASNSAALLAQIREAGGRPLDLGIARDRPEEIRALLATGLNNANLVVSSAGVSKGEHDFVKSVLHELKVRTVFSRLRIRPGQPLVFGRIWDRHVFGLPGNPVSAMVCFEEFVRPLIRKMAGRADLDRPEILAHTEETLQKPPGLTQFLRCRIFYRKGGWWVKTTGPQGSAILSSMVKADGLLVFPEKQEKIEAGGIVRVQVLRREILEAL